MKYGKRHKKGWTMEGAKRKGKRIIKGNKSRRIDARLVKKEMTTKKGRIERRHELK